MLRNTEHLKPRAHLTMTVLRTCRTDEHGTRLHGSSSSVSGGSADLEEEEMFGDMDIDESNVVMRSIPVHPRGVPASWNFTPLYLVLTLTHMS